MKGIKIGQISEILGIQPSAIRYYEDCGLVEPMKDTQSGYRLYNPVDCGKIMCARSFRSMGFSIQDSKELMTQRDLLEQLDLWNKGSEALDRQMERLEAQKRTLEYWRDLYISAEELRKTCRAFEREGFYYISLGKWGETRSSKKFRDTLKEWIEYMPESSYWGIFDASKVQVGEPVILDCGFGIRNSCVVRENLAIPETAVYYSPCSCIQSVLYCGRDMVELAPELFDHVRHYSDEHELELVRTGHWHFLRLSDSGEGYYVFSFPVKK